MNLTNSESSSGCESGWTMYFDQYSNYSNSHQDQYNRIGEEETLRSHGGYMNDDYIEEKKDDEDEDLSMASDASSGPPHLHEDEDCSVRNEYISNISNQTKGNQKNKKGPKIEDDKSVLDDTASSPVGDFPKEKSTFSKKHFSFLKTSLKGKGESEKPPTGGLRGRSGNN